MIRSDITIAVAVAMLTVCISARADTVTWFEFSGWDDALVKGGGQTFLDVFDDVDVTVTGTPGHSRTSWVDGDGAIRTGGDSDTHSFTFAFSAALPVVVSVDSLDLREIISVANTGGGAAMYDHHFGSAPIESGDLTLEGTGVGQDPALGAAKGRFDLGATTGFTWEYTALMDNKYERFQVGTLVPEPASCSLIALVGLAALGIRRRM
jgi:hypothetical protein